MKSSKLVSVSAIFIMLIAGLGFTASASAGTFSAAVIGTSIPFGPCGISMTYTGTPGATNTATLDASTFAGTAYSGFPACNTSMVGVDYDIDVTWGGSNTSATVEHQNGNGDRFEVTDTNIGCTYGLSNNVAVTSTTDQFGFWSGTGSATSNQFPCIFQPATVVIFNGLFTP